ncbi:MAG: universal stress protein, partial [Desulfofustis sp.]|nr:universal stress protein [Desulfofustis sp.]
MEQGTRRVLLAVNGSDESMTAIRYVCGCLPPRGSEITLFQVLSSVPEEFWDLEKDPVWAKRIEIVRTWEDEQKKRCNDFMDRAGAHFRASGFSADTVTTKIGVQKEGIAR